MKKYEGVLELNGKKYTSRIDFSRGEPMAQVMVDGEYLDYDKFVEWLYEKNMKVELTDLALLAKKVIDGENVSPVKFIKQRQQQREN